MQAVKSSDATANNSGDKYHHINFKYDKLDKDGHGNRLKC
jgi:hypothetical protein